MWNASPGINVASTGLSPATSGVLNIQFFNHEKPTSKALFPS